MIISVSFCIPGPDFHTLMPRQYFLPANKDLEGEKVRRCSRSSCASHSRSSTLSILCAWHASALHRLALIQITSVFQIISFSIPNSSATSVALPSSTKQGFAKVASLLFTCESLGNPHMHMRLEMVLGQCIISSK